MFYPIQSRENIMKREETLRKIIPKKADIDNKKGKMGYLM